MDRIKDKIRDENIDPKNLNDKKLLEILKSTEMYDKISSDVKGIVSTTKPKAEPSVEIKNSSAKRALLVKIG